jgi:hypothetical protein
MGEMISTKKPEKGTFNYDYKHTIITLNLLRHEPQRTLKQLTLWRVNHIYFSWSRKNSVSVTSEIKDRSEETGKGGNWIGSLH